jgi:hypothetical protein
VFDWFDFGGGFDLFGGGDVFELADLGELGDLGGVTSMEELITADGGWGDWSGGMGGVNYAIPENVADFPTVAASDVAAGGGTGGFNLGAIGTTLGRFLDGVTRTDSGSRAYYGRNGYNARYGYGRPQPIAWLDGVVSGQRNPWDPVRDPNDPTMLLLIGAGVVALFAFAAR